jgi:hypothetical protein
MVNLDHVMKMPTRCRLADGCPEGIFLIDCCRGGESAFTPQLQTILAMIAGDISVVRISPADPTILVINNTRTGADLMALRSLAAHIRVVTPHMRPTMPPEAVCWVRALGSEYAGCLRRRLLTAALDRACQHLARAACIRRKGARDSRVCNGFA